MTIRAVLVPQPETVYLNPIIGVIQLLTARGQDVAVYSPHDLREHLTKAGLDTPTYSVPVAADAPSRSGRTKDLTARFEDRRWLLRWYEYAMLGVVQQHIAPLRTAIATFRPDVICVDPTMYAGAIVG